MRFNSMLKRFLFAYFNILFDLKWIEMWICSMEHFPVGLSKLDGAHACGYANKKNVRQIKVLWHAVIV